MYQEVLKYESILNQLGSFIENGPYKLDYILEQLQISRSAFYNKRKHGNFSLEEVKKLAKMYDDISLSERLYQKLEEGLGDISKGKVHEFQKAVAESKAKYGL